MDVWQTSEGAAIINAVHGPGGAERQDWRLTLDHQSQETLDPAKAQRFDELTEVLITPEMVQSAMPRNLQERRLLTNFLDTHVKPLGAEDFKALEYKVLTEIFRRAIAAAEDIPTSVKHDDLEAIKSLGDHLAAPGSLMGLLARFEGAGAEKSVMSQERMSVFNHDLIHIVYPLIPDIDAAIWESTPPDRRSALIQSIISRLATCKKLYLQILRANYSLFIDSPEFKEFDIQEALLPTAQQNATRFRYEVSTTTDEDAVASDGEILICCPKDLKIFGDSNQIALLVHNLIKNPLKIARTKWGDDQKIAVTVKVEKLDEDCISITVKNTATSVSYDAQKEYYTETALQKLKWNMQLSILEAMLLDEHLRAHVTPHAFYRQMLAMGESATGGTGVGLALARRIVEDVHQGYLRPYEPPTTEKAFGVQAILPQIQTTPVARRIVTQRTVSGELLRAMGNVINRN